MGALAGTGAPGALLAMVLLGLLSPPAAAAAATGPFAGRAQAGALAVTVERDRDDGQVVAGRLTTYRITVDNSGSRAVTTPLEAATSRHLGDLTASDGAVDADGADWTVTVPQEGTATVTLSGVYSDPPEEVDTPYRVVFTACVVGNGGAARACDSDIAELMAASWLERWWWLTAPAAAVAAWALHRRRRVVPIISRDLEVDLGELDRARAPQ